MPDRPEPSKAGVVSVNVAQSAADTVDAIADVLGLPEPSSIVMRLTPDYWADALGLPTPDDFVDDLLTSMDDALDIDFPPER